MSRKIFARTAAIVGGVLLTSSLSLAQQPPTPPAVKAMEELAGGSAGSLGVNTKTYSAVVGGAGVLILGPSGSSSLPLSAGTYQVTFPSDISKCVYTATAGTSPAGFPAPAFVVVTPRSGNANAIFVRTFAPGGTVQNNPFHIQVQC